MSGSGVRVSSQGSGTSAHVVALRARGVEVACLIILDRRTTIGELFTSNQGHGLTSSANMDARDHAGLQSSTTVPAGAASAAGRDQLGTRARPGGVPLARA